MEYTATETDITTINSNPFSARYGDHLSQAEVHELIAPHSESVEQVAAWLAAHGFQDEHLSRSPAGDWIKVKVPVSLAEEMFDTVSHIHDVDVASNAPHCIH